MNNIEQPALTEHYIIWKITPSPSEFGRLLYKSQVSVHLAKKFVRRLSFVVCRPLTINIVIFISETPQPNEVKLSKKHQWKVLCNDSLLFLLNAAFLAEKQQIPILYSFVWQDRSSYQQSITLEASTLTITLPM
jgi:hypothetical protein